MFEMTNPFALRSQSERFWQEIGARGIRPAGPARFYGLVAPYTGNHLSPEHYCYRLVVPV